MNFFKELKYIDASRQELVGRDDITWTGPDGETLTNDEMLALMAEEESCGPVTKTHFYGTEEELANYLKELRQQNND